jgi:Na+/proline symporter
MQILGGWTVLAILCASMSTATGAILATSTVMAHNIFRKVSTALQRGIRLHTAFQ